jgi:hypothetical protein
VTKGWELSIGPPAAAPEQELDDAATWRLVFRRSGNHEASISLDGASPQAALIDELITDLTVRWAGATLTRMRAGPTQDGGDADATHTDFSFADYRSLLGRRIIWDAWTPLARTGDPAAILWSLVDATQREPGGNLHITRGAWPAMPAAAIVLEPGRTILETAGILSAAAAGFDWDITPGPFGSVLSVWPGRRGRDTDLVLDVGGVTATFSRAVATDTFANAVRVSGGQSSTGVAIAAVRRDAADVARRPEGRWEYADSGSGLDSAAATVAAATASLAARQQISPSWSGRLVDGSWTGPDQLWLGDRIRWVCHTGRLHADLMLPVEEIAVAGGADIATPTVEITVGAPRPGRGQRPAALDKRLATLEQR